MPKNMQPIASSEGVRIYAPNDGRFSFFNSPYPAHLSYSGIDVYSKSLFGDSAPSPIAGKVVKIRRVKGPREKSFEVSSYDYVILLKSLENPERWVKLLHVEPLVRVGEKVEPGDDLGIYVRSGFFNPWTDPHIHVEVRRPSDPLRAKGGFKFRRLLKINAKNAVRNLLGTVIESRPEYCIISLDERSQHGITVGLADMIGVIDAGIPHYGWIGLHVEGTPPLNEVITLCGKKIGKVETFSFNMCIARCVRNLDFKLRGKQVGLSFYLHSHSDAFIKIIPYGSEKLELENSERISIM